MKKFLICCLLVCIFYVSSVEATPGRLKGDSIVTCNGVTYGKHSDSNPHWHVASRNSNGTYNATGSAIYSNPCTNSNSSNNAGSSKVETSKSSDNSLFKVLVDGNEIEVEDKMNYITVESEVEIAVTTNDKNATFSVDNKPLEIGLNTINIVVTSESGAERLYVIEIFRENLDSNTNIRLVVENKEIVFKDWVATIDVESNITKLNYDCQLESGKSKLAVYGDMNELEIGKNEILFEVTAEDGTVVKYSLIVNREEQEISGFSFIFCLLWLSGLAYGIYYIVDYNRKKT